MWRATCRASGAVAIAVMLVLGVMASANAADVRHFEEIAASEVDTSIDAG